MYDFDEMIRRNGLSTMKWEAEIQRTGYEDLLCFGTADMDFSSPEPVLQAVRQIADAGHLGYPYPPEAYYDSIRCWLERIGGWRVDVRKASSVNVGIYTAVWCVLDALTRPGDEVIIQTPVHFCFRQMLLDNDRVPVCNPLVLRDGRYEMNFEALERCFTENTRLFWLCNPHNPVGRAWTREELGRLGEICERHDVMILSDDVYCGLVYPGYRYTPMASLSKELSRRTITCYSPSKIYNTTGIKFSFVIAENPEILERYNRSLRKLDLTYGMNLFGIQTAIAAFDRCDGWVEALMEYIAGNHRYAEMTVRGRMPLAHITEADSTYFAWIDMKCLGFEEGEAEAYFEREAHIIISPGEELGPGGEGFIRLNLACRRAVLSEGMERMARAWEKRIHSLKH